MQSFLKQYFVREKKIQHHLVSVKLFSCLQYIQYISLIKVQVLVRQIQMMRINQTRISFINQYFVAVLDMNLY